MATKVVMPQMGYDMQQGRIARWLKKEGEPVQRGEIIAEIETDKAVVEMQAYASGVLRKVLVPEGVTVPVGQAIGVIAAPDEPLPEDLTTPAAQPAAKESALASAPATVPPQAAAVAPTPTTGEVKASPLARRLAQEHGVDLGQVRGTGPGGRIVEADIHRHLEGRQAAPAAPQAVPAGGPTAAAAPAAPPPPVEEVEPHLVELTRMRQAIARLTTRAKQEVPHFYVSAEVDMTAGMELRVQLNRALNGQGVRVSVNDFIIRACVLALQKYPNFNAFYHDGKLQMNPRINIGVAVALEGGQGLMVPALLDCGAKSLADLARASKGLVERANKGGLTAEEYGGATFSISNLGMFDVDSFAAIIHPPQSGVLAVGSVRPRPVVKEGQVAVAQTMHATLSVDHRVSDGADAARFLAEVKRLLENPVTLLL
ncbi:MAG: 2-oxo acid dehydrogenase subunit E2 [Chloroflexi bacterium]|nr:2-oxo acid dehydrogenase subunit E2 [Chloroflexota bacterium]